MFKDRIGIHPAIHFYQDLLKNGLKANAILEINKSGWTLDYIVHPYLHKEELIMMTPVTLKTLVEASVEAALSEVIKPQASLRRPVPEINELTEEELKIGGFYNWKNQPERLVYLGRNLNPGQRHWHQFARIEAPTHVWCEVLRSDICRFEKTKC